MVSSFGFGGYDLGFRIKDLGCRIYRFRVLGSGFTASDARLRVFEVRIHLMNPKFGDKETGV
jgi:hypothetical protein